MQSVYHAHTISSLTDRFSVPFSLRSLFLSNQLENDILNHERKDARPSTPINAAAHVSPTSAWSLNNRVYAELLTQ